VNIFQKIIGTVFKPYYYNVLRKEQGKLVDAILSKIPINIFDLSTHSPTRIYGFFDSKQFPGFHFMAAGISEESLRNDRIRGKNYRIYGMKIYSNRTKKLENLEILIHENLPAALKIENSELMLNDFDITKFETSDTKIEDFYFPPSETDIFYDSLDSDLKEMFDKDDFFDIDFNNKTFYAFYDLEDGNYLAVDNNLKVYSLVHDARPMATGMKITFKEILTDIANGKFDKEKHLDERYSKSK
jgi:hypothetical protein